MVGTGLLAATLRVPHGSLWFTVLGLLVAATWAVGSFVSGPIPFQPDRRMAWHTLVGPVVAGVDGSESALSRRSAQREG